MKHRNIVTITIMIFAIMFGNSADTFAKNDKKKKEITEAELENTYWKLYEMNGKKVVTPMDAKEAYLKFNSKKETLEGYAGCNMVTGNYEEDKDNKLTFTAAMTERYCEDMTIENYITEILNHTNRYELNGLYLLLFHDNYLLGVFEAQYYCD